jgi:hypothetical protein
MTKPKKPLRGLFASTEAPVRTPARPVVPPPKIRKDEPQRPSTPQNPKPNRPERLAPPPRITPSTEIMIMQEEKVVEVEIQSAPPATPAHVAPTLPVSVQTQDRIMNIQYNFDLMRSTRESWNETDYAEFLRRLDALQTEAFILRGKLLAEAKDRFFETNKTGWAEYCETTLGMNYTTANQYIRVATEFDVTSHQRSDFGFEHFKALLPLPAEARTEFFSSPEAMSVKLIRTRVKEILASTGMGEGRPATPSALRQSVRLTRMLETIKSEVITHGSSFSSLNQQQRWQVAAACQNIAAHLNHLAQSLNADPLSAMASLQSAGMRAGAFATADGVATMQDVLVQPSQSGNPI